eukprot:c24209_g1_i1 orf=653-1270(-)
MASCHTWMRYAFIKLLTSAESSMQDFKSGRREYALRMLIRNWLTGHMTFTFFYRGEEMAPTFASEGASVLIRPLPGAISRLVFAGDVLLVKDPRFLDGENKLVLRRVVATEGDGMLSSDVDDKPFYLNEQECWVLCDNKALNPKDAPDSRLFGPLPSDHIVGRAIYAFQSRDQHGPVQNSDLAKKHDFPVLAAELDIDKLCNRSD